MSADCIPKMSILDPGSLPIVASLTVQSMLWAGETVLLLQVTEIDNDVLSFDVIEETLRATNLGTLQMGSPVNFERSARVGDEIGGHNVSGHVATTATIASIKETDNNTNITFQVLRMATQHNLMITTSRRPVARL